MSDPQSDALQERVARQMRIAVIAFAGSISRQGPALQAKPSDIAAHVALLSELHHWRVCFGTYEAPAAELDAKGITWATRDAHILRDHVDRARAAYSASARRAGIPQADLDRLESSATIDAYTRPLPQGYDAARPNTGLMLEPAVVEGAIATAMRIVVEAEQTLAKAPQIQAGVSDDEYERARVAEFNAILAERDAALEIQRERSNIVRQNLFADLTPMDVATLEAFAAFLRRIPTLAPAAEALARAGRKQLMELIQHHADDSIAASKIVRQIIADRQAANRGMMAINWQGYQDAVDSTLRITQGWKAAFAGGKVVGFIIK